MMMKLFLLYAEKLWLVIVSLFHFIFLFTETHKNISASFFSLFSKWQRSFTLSKLNFLLSSAFCRSASLADLIWFITYFTEGWLRHIILIHMLICFWDDPPWLAERAWDFSCSCSFLYWICSPFVFSSHSSRTRCESRGFIISPTHEILLTYLVFFPLQWERHLWDKQSIEMSPDSMESQRAAFLSQRDWHVDIRH